VCKSRLGIEMKVISVPTLINKSNKPATRAFVLIAVGDMALLFVNPKRRGKIFPHSH
jgi:hypothetical protein